MKTIHVHTRFDLTHPDQTVQRFNPGMHQVEDAIAAHWYVEAHSVVVADASTPSVAGEPGAKPERASKGRRNGRSKA